VPPAAPDADTENTHQASTASGSPVSSTTTIMRENHWDRHRPGRRVRKAEQSGRTRSAQATGEVQDDIDAAYHAKYDRYGPRVVGSVTGPGAHQVTIRLIR